MTSTFSRKDIICLSAVALGGLFAYLSGLDYALADGLGNRTTHGISLFFSTEYYLVFMVFSFAFLLHRRRSAALALVVSVVLVFLMQAAFTEFSPRPRPPQALPQGDVLMRFIKSSGGSSSFFSGHAATSMAASTMLILEGVNPALAVAFAVPVMVSRITLVQHYLSDVLGGIVFGYVAGRSVYARLAKRRDEPI